MCILNECRYAAILHYKINMSNWMLFCRLEYTIAIKSQSFSFLKDCSGFLHWYSKWQKKGSKSAREFKKISEWINALIHINHGDCATVSRNPDNPFLILANEIVIWHCVVWGASGVETISNCLRWKQLPESLIHQIILLLPGRWEMHSSKLSFSSKRNVSASMQMSPVSSLLRLVAGGKWARCSAELSFNKGGIKNSFGSDSQVGFLCCLSYYRDCS